MSIPQHSQSQQFLINQGDTDAQCPQDIPNSIQCPEISIQVDSKSSIIKPTKAQSEVSNTDQESDIYLLHSRTFIINKSSKEKPSQDIKLQEKRRKDTIEIQNIYQEVNTDIQNTIAKVYEDQLIEKVQKQRKLKRQVSRIPSYKINQAIDQHLQEEKQFQKRQMRQLSKTFTQSKHQEANDLKDRWKQSLLESYKFHKITLEELYQTFCVNSDKGLNEEDVAKRRKIQGFNKFSEVKDSWILTLLNCMFGDIFNDMLWCGGTACLIAYELNQDDPQNLYLGLVIYFVVMFTSYLSFAQNRSSRRILRSFNFKETFNYTVLRQGLDIVVNEEELVTGDIVLIKKNQRIPCDLRIIQSSKDLLVDNSCLTGESEPQRKSVECVKFDTPLEATNILFQGTVCIQGSAKCVVINIGDSTIFGQIIQIARQQVAPQSPLKKDIQSFIKLIGIIALVLSILLVLIAYFLQKLGFIQLIILFIGLMVGNVPTSLVGSIQILLTIVAKQLQKKQILVKNLETVESLGSVTCIVSDISFTQNKVEVKHLWYNLQLKQENEVKFEDLHFQTFFKCALLSCDIRLEDQQRERTDSDILLKQNTDLSLLKYLQRQKNIDEYLKKYKYAKQGNGRSAKLHYNQIDRFSLCIVEDPKPDSIYTLYIKGDPKKIWHFSRNILLSNQSQLITDDLTTQFEKINKLMGEQGEQIQGFAYMDMPKDQFPKGFKFVTKSFIQFNFQITDLTFVGIVGFLDLPKVNVPEAVYQCKQAGIKFIMATDEQFSTALSIARMVNIFPKDAKVPEELIDEQKQIGNLLIQDQAFAQCDAVIINGDQFRKQKELDIKLQRDFEKATLNQWLQKRYIIFTNTTPDQKLEIVKTCQKMGHVVGVVGTEVNSAPLLKQADIGMTMGASGSNSAKDSADMVFMNDDFSLISTCVLEGRRIFDNLKKLVLFVLTTSVPSIIPYALSVILSIPIAISSIQLLCVDIGCNFYSSIALGYEESEPGLMKRKPRNRNERLCSFQVILWSYLVWGMFEAAGGMFTFLAVMHYYGFEIASLQGITNQKAYPKPPTDRFYGFDPTQFNLGNPNLHSSDCTLTSDIGFLDWFSNSNGKCDLRNVYVKCDPISKQWKSALSWGSCQNEKISFATDSPVCYSTDALKFAQTSYYSTLIMMQAANLFMSKSRYQSVFKSQFNKNQIFGIFQAIIFCVFLTFTPGVQLVFNFRPVNFLLIFAPSTFAAIAMFCLNELRTYFIRNANNPKTKSIINKYIYW